MMILLFLGDMRGRLRVVVIEICCFVSRTLSCICKKPFLTDLSAHCTGRGMRWRRLGDRQIRARNNVLV
jgi:hypothetical protein